MFFEATQAMLRIDVSNVGNVQMVAFSFADIWCIFLQQYRIQMDIGNSKNYLGIIYMVLFQL